MFFNCKDEFCLHSSSKGKGGLASGSTGAEEREELVRSFYAPHVIYSKWRSSLQARNYSMTSQPYIQAIIMSNRIVTLN